MQMTRAELDAVRVLETCLVVEALERNAVGDLRIIGDAVAEKSGRRDTDIFASSSDVLVHVAAAGFLGHAVLLGVARRAGAQHDALGVAHQLECRISGRAGSDGVRLSIELHDSRFAVFESEMAERR